MNTKQEWHDGTATCLMFHLLHQDELPLTAAYAPQEKIKREQGTAIFQVTQKICQDLRGVILDYSQVQL